MKVVTYLGSLVQLCCGEGETLQTNITCVCAECSQCLDHTGFAPAHGGVCLPDLHCSGSKLLCWVYCPKRALPFIHFLGISCSGLGTPQRHRFGWRAFCALPRSEQLKRRGAWQAHCPRWAVHLNHLLGPGCSVCWLAAVRAPSQVCCVSPLGS